MPTLAKGGVNEPADELRIGRIGQVEIDEIGRVGKRRPFAVRAHIDRPVEALRIGLRLALLLAGLPPFADVLGMRRIAHVEDHHDVAVEARIAGREIGVFAARIGIAVRAGGAAHPRADLLGIFRIGNVPQQHRRQRVLLRREAVERGHHQVVVQRHLRRDDAFVVGLERNEFHIARIGRIGDVDDAPALIEGMALVEIPLVVRGVLDGDLERAVAPAERRKADLLHVLGLRARRNRIGERTVRREQRSCDQYAKA